MALRLFRHLFLATVHSRRIPSIANTANDAWVKTRFSPRLSGRRSEHTAPEVALRSALHRAGFRFRLHRRLAKRLKVDIALLRYRVCIFVDGCWWHQCSKHKTAPKTGPNAERWAAKFARIKERDLQAVAIARSMGYWPIRVWECDINSDINAVVRRISRLAAQAARSI